MSHPEQLGFVSSIKAAFPGFFSNRRVLEIGSLDINGTVRTMFDAGSYVGLDVAPGPGVDVVAQGQDYDAPDGSFDTVICCEVMEHNPHWQATMENMARLCRSGGLVVMTCASTGRKEHGTTRTSPVDSPLTIGIGWEYYRNLTARNFRSVIPFGDMFSVWDFYYNLESFDLYFVGFRSGSSAPANARSVLARLHRHYRLANVRNAVASAKKATLIRLVGEERYNAGPVRPW